MDIVFIAWIVAALAMMGSGVHDVFEITKTFRWLKRKGESRAQDQAEAPFVAILLPVLREQRVIGATLQALASLKYPLQRLRIFVITTEKEHVQREAARAKLGTLAKDIAMKRLPASLLLEKYLGVFSEDALKKIIGVAQQKGGEQQVHLFLLEAFNTYPTTIDLVKEYIDKLNQQAGMPLFTHLHHPGSDGDVNQQLAFALTHLLSYLPDEVNAKTPCYLAVYNADSRPHPDTLEAVASICSDYYRRYASYPPAMQQSAVFLENIAHLGSKWAAFLLQSAALLQTRWVLAHEIPRLRRQSASALRFKSGQLNLWQRLTGAEFALCVGHGFFLRYDLAEQLKLFNTSTICDDFLWSFRLCLGHIPILPIPVLESAENPTTVMSLILQRRSWFLGYTEYPRYRMTALREGRFRRSDVELVTLHGLIRAARWLLLSPVVFLTFTLPMLTRSWQMLAITCVVYAIYGLLTFWMILTELDVLRSRSGGEWSPSSLSDSHRLGTLIFSLPVFLLESVGLWWCLFQRLGWSLARRPPYRKKTER